MAIEYIPMVIGCGVAVTACRSIRIYRSEEGLTQLKRWQLRAIATLIAGTTTGLSEVYFYSMDLPKAVMLALAVGVATPMLWKVVISILEKQYPSLKSKLHPELDYTPKVVSDKGTDKQ